MSHPADATALADDFAAGRAHPRATLAALLARIERLDPLIGACNGLATTPALSAAADAAAARWRAGTPRSSLDGIPFGVKANIAVAGLPWHAGIAALRDRVARADAICVGRLRAAGLIPVAVLNMHEAALGVTSDNPAFRTTCNPWASDRIPGGSSGGSAAAVASGMLPLALGTDDLGSVRLPSALCGVVGFKPGYGEIPTAGVEPLCGALDHVGIHARSVRDAAAAFTILRGRPVDSGLEASPGSRAPPPLATWVLGAPGLVDRQIDDAVRRVTDNAEGGAPPGETLDWSHVDVSRLRRAGLLLCEREAARHFAAALNARPGGFSAEFRELVAWGAAQSSARARAAVDRIAHARTTLLEALRDRLLVSPAAPHLAPFRNAPIPPTLADFAVPPAIAGVPAISVPVPNDAETPPVGLQIAGAASADVLAAAADLYPGTAPVVEPRMAAGHPLPPTNRD